jgi:hypothetical protein
MIIAETSFIFIEFLYQEVYKKYDYSCDILHFSWNSWAKTCLHVHDKGVPMFKLWVGKGLAC